MKKKEELIKLDGASVVNNGTTLLIDGKLVDVNAIKTIDKKLNKVILAVNDVKYELTFKTENAATRFTEGFNI